MFSNVKLEKGLFKENSSSEVNMENICSNREIEHNLSTRILLVSFFFEDTFSFKLIIKSFIIHIKKLNNVSFSTSGRIIINIFNTTSSLCSFKYFSFSLKMLNINKSDSH